MASVGHVQYPEQTHLELGGRGSARIPVKASTPQLRLTFRTEIHVRNVMLEYLDDRQCLVQRILERFCAYEFQIVVRRVVFRVTSIRSSGETADSQVEAR